MHDIIQKTSFAIGAYWESSRATRRQYNASRIEQVQNRKLARLVQYCAKHIKYYQESFHDAGMNPDQIKTVDDIQRLPFLTKEDLRSRNWDFLPKRLPACRVSRTSGSTGIPVCIFSDWRSRRFNSAAVIRFRKALNIPLIGRPAIHLLNTDRQPDRPPHWTFMPGIYKTYYFNPYICTRQNRLYAEELFTSLKKPIVAGNASAVRTLAENIHDQHLPSVSPGWITTGGEILLSQTRLFVETILGTQVSDIYACNETRDIAWQCCQGKGYHINADNVLVEIIKDNRPAKHGESGEVVLTDLNRYVMPIIRYKNGDWARFIDTSCSCGSKLPLIGEIAGRTGDNIVLPNGRILLWNDLKSQMTHPHIRQFQLVQNSEGQLDVKYIPEQRVDTRQIDALLHKRFQDLVYGDIAITISHVHMLVPHESGKYKLVESNYTHCI